MSANERLSASAIQKLEYWMQEVTELICYQSDVPEVHKRALVEALEAFKLEITG